VALVFRAQSHFATSASIGFVLLWFRKKWLTCSGLFLIFLLGFAKLYVGVHYYFDILTGWALGGMVLLSVIKFPSLISWVDKPLKNSRLAVIVVTISALMYFFRDNSNICHFLKLVFLPFGYIKVRDILKKS
jgi:hypothetical protein